MISLKSYLLSPRFHFNRIQFNFLTLCLIGIGLVSGSYLTISKIVQLLAANNTEKTWLFNASTAANYTTNHILVDNRGAIPSESNNLFTNSSFDESNNDWISMAIAPDGWVVAPKLSPFTTNDFLVMKYEAKALDTQTSSVVLKNGVYGSSWAGTNTQTRYQAVSVPEGLPWVNIAQNHSTNFDALEACAAISLGSTNAHLINNNEWMSLARNIEGVSTNWTNGIGTILVRGNTDSTVYGRIELNGFDPLSGVNRRIHYLNNGEIIWDLAGNVNDMNSDIQTTAIYTTTDFAEWNSPNIAAGARELYGPSSADYTSRNGMGYISGGALGSIFNRGGGFNLSSNAGLFYLGVGNPPSFPWSLAGFRCSSPPLSISHSFQSDSGVNSSGGNQVINSSFIDSKLVQIVNVGNSASYDLSVLVYDLTSGNQGGTLDSSIATIYANGITYPSTQYTSVGNGWYRLSATVIGTSAPVQYGLAIKSGKSVKTDDFYLTKSVNRFDNPSFVSNTNNWSIRAVSGSLTPDGWIVAPGDSHFNTSDFLVMKYEAKAYDTQTTAVVSLGGYSSGPGWAGLKSQTRYQAVSTTTSRPWVNIAQTHATNFDANDACRALTIGTTSAHLISNQEWSTLANNVANIDSNWTEGSVGQGSIFRGNSNTVMIPMTSISNLTGINQRTFNLTNGDLIWDLSGNAWEWSSDTILRKDMPVSWNGTTTSSNVWVTSDYESGSINYINYYKLGSPLQQKTVEPLNFTYPHNALYGLGRIYSYSSTDVGNTTTYAFTHGGKWDSSYDAGVFALNLSNLSTGQTSTVGFRCASAPLTLSQSFQSVSGRNGSGTQNIISDPLADTQVFQTLNLGDTDTYLLSVYVYDNTDGNVGLEVNSSVAQLLIGTSAIDTTYTDMTDGWWKLSTSLTGTNTLQSFGVLVKANKTVYLDDYSLVRSQAASVYTKLAYLDHVNSWDSLSVGITAGSNAVVKYQLCTTDGTTCEANIGTTASTWQYWNGTVWTNSDSTLTTANTLDQLTPTVMHSLPISTQKLSVKVLMTYESDDLPILNSLTLGLTIDDTPPTNASSLVMHQEISPINCLDSDNCWTKLTGPTFSWNPGSDEENGSGFKGYCLYLGTDPDGNPASDKGKLGVSPVSIVNAPCQFIISSSSLDLSTSGYLASALSNTDDFDLTTPHTYYLNIKAVDVAGNPSLTSQSLRFRYDGTNPTNVSFISPASGNFSNVIDMNFSWPITGTASALDDQSGLLGWQYQINSTSGTWLGSTTSPELNLEYIPSGTSVYYLTSRDTISSGNNVVYFRAVDRTGNVSEPTSGNLSFGGNAPSFLSTDAITVAPTSSESNSFSLSWPSAQASTHRQVSHYYYLINVSPPSNLDTLQGNISTYIDNGTATTVSTNSLPNVNKGTNTVYVVAIDDEIPPNYSPSNYITGTFTLNSNTPDNVGDLVASDSSIKSKSLWNVTLTWTAPTYQGAGNLTYQIYRSLDNLNFTLVGTSSGLSYVDNVPTSKLYYYKIYTKDGANAVSSGTNAVSLLPTGKWTSPPTLSSGPEVGSITPRKATITWSTDRNSDSKIQSGTTSNNYINTETSNSDQITSHSIQLTGLTPSTTYYYRAKWTDEDGNTGTSDEKSFITQSTPSVKDVSTSGINLSSATIQFTSNGSSKVKLYYGTSTSFGGLKILDTSTSETVYTINLSDLSDGTKYYYKINTIDSDGYEYEGTVLDFTTLPRPRISNVQLQEVIGTAQTTLKITWTTNTPISSIISYYPEGKPELSRDQISIDLIDQVHEMTITSLLPQTNYYLLIGGADVIGNQAASNIQKFTTASDSRPPSISGVKVEGSTVPSVASTGQESLAQLIISWNTDEPATSQVEFGEGTGVSYSQKTQEDTNLTSNHLVVISNLTPSKVYHLRTISKDSVGNISHSIDTVMITPKATDNALDLVVTNLGQIFGFLGGIIK